MGRCSVLGCKSDSETKLKDLSFHSFPEQKITRYQWIKATGRENWTPKNYSKICGRHFLNELKIKKKKFTLLFPGAVPTLAIKASSQTPASTSNISSQPSITCMTNCLKNNNSTPLPSARASVEMVNFEAPTSILKEILMSTASCKNTNVSKNIKNPLPSTQMSMEMVNYDVTTSLKENLMPISSVTSPNSTPRSLKRKLKQEKQKSAERLKKMKALREKCRRLTKKVANMDNVLADLKAKFLVSEEEGDLLHSIDPVNRDFLKKYLCPETSARKYTPALRKFALCLNFISPRAYLYVRQQFNTCLPHPSTLTAWYKSVDANPGFTSESLNCIKLLAERKEKKLYCALSMDEMAIRRHVQWDGEKCVGIVNYGDALDGHNVTEAREALVFMVTCINDRWKIPIGYFFIDGCNGEQKSNLVKQCVNLLIDTGIFVVSLTFDGCPANFSMARSLGCVIGCANIKPYFSLKGHDIVIVPDPAHMLKLLRNTLGQKKQLTNAFGEKISWQFIDSLNNLQENEGLHLANRLKNQHINFSKQIMKVKLAAQTFSKSVANAIQFCDKNLNIPEFSGSDATVEFIIKVNDLFDMLNSRNLNAYGFKKPLNEKNAKQIFDYLSEIELYIKGLKLEGRPILETNRRVGFSGFLICIESLRKIHTQYILTEKLNFFPFYKLSQDHLECFFSAIRSKGGFNNNPTAFQFQGAYKRLVVHGEIKSLTSGNCVALEDIKILTHTEVRYESKINRYTSCTNLENENPDNEDSKHDIMSTIYNDHDYIPNPSMISTYADEIIPYISGFVVKKIKKSLKCEDCLISLVSDKYAGLIFTKDMGGLIYPSRDVIKICKLTEKIFRRHWHKGLSFFGEKNIMPRLILDTFKQCRSELFTGKHFDTQPFIGNHRVLLIKAITARYLEVRIHHATKKFAPQEKIRNIHTKLVLFKGQ